MAPELSAALSTSPKKSLSKLSEPRSDSPTKLPSVVAPASTSVALPVYGDIHMDTAKGVPNYHDVCMNTSKSPFNDDIYMETARGTASTTVKQGPVFQAREKELIDSAEVKRKATVAQLCKFIHALPYIDLFMFAFTRLPGLLFPTPGLYFCTERPTHKI